MNVAGIDCGNRAPLQQGYRCRSGQSQQQNGHNPHHRPARQAAGRGHWLHLSMRNEKRRYKSSSEFGVALL